MPTALSFVPSGPQVPSTGTCRKLVPVHLRIRLHKKTNCVTCSDRANCANIGRQAGRFTLPPNNFRPLSCIFGTKSGQALFRLSMRMCIELELQGRYGNKKFHSKIHPGMRPHVPHHIWPSVSAATRAEPAIAEPGLAEPFS